MAHASLGEPSSPVARSTAPRTIPSSFIIGNIARAKVAALNKIREGLARATTAGEVAIRALDKTIDLLTQMKAKIVPAQDKSNSTA